MYSRKMKTLEEHRRAWPDKSDEWLFERLSNELKSKVEEIHRLVEENNEFHKKYDAKPFSYEWWVKVGRKAYGIAENYVGQNYKWEVAEYCSDRADDKIFK